MRISQVHHSRDFGLVFFDLPSEPHHLIAGMPTPPWQSKILQFIHYIYILISKNICICISIYNVDMCWSWAVPALFCRILTQCAAVGASSWCTPTWWQLKLICQYFSNTWCNLDKYILQFGQIYFVIWNTQI